ncbi:MAG: alpha/beta hydrolase-fold protein [Acidobacteriota bacterium]
MSWEPYWSDGVRDVPGHLRVWRGFPSPELGNHRDILVWLPEEEPRAPLPVLYFQDGQNVFDEHTSFSGSWGAAATLAELASEGMPVIAVAVSHAGHDRIVEYSPFVDPKHGGGRGDAYLEFLSSSVKPAVDARFPTHRDPSRTGLVGSSLGGLIATYGVFKRPDLFGLAAALSPSYWFAEHSFVHWLGSRQYVPAQFYLDTGRFERGRVKRWWPPSDAVGTALGSRRYVRSVRGVHRRLRKMGYVDGVDLRFTVDPEGFHSEECWRRRLPQALTFLLKESTATGAWAALD